MKELIIELTNRCFNNCIHCSSKNCGAEKLHDISLSEIEPVVRSAIKAGFDSVVFSGGEPLLHPEFDKFINYFSSINIPIKLYTSGVTHDAMYADSKYLKLFSLIDTITVSCYSCDPEIHNAVTRNDSSHQKLHEFICRFYKYANRVEMNFVPMACNASEVNSVYHKYSNKVNRFNVLKLVRQGNADKHWEKLVAPSDTLDKELMALRPKPNTKIGNSFGALSNASYRCEAGSCKMCISFDGYVIPCEVFKSTRKNFKHCTEYAQNDLLFSMDARIYATHDYARGCQAGAICYGG